MLLAAAWALLMPITSIKSKSLRTHDVTSRIYHHRLRIPLASNVWAEIFGICFKHQALPDSFDQMLFFQEIISVAFHILEKDERIDIHAILDAAHGPL